MYILALILLDVVYISFFFIASMRLNVVADHYFLGFGPKLFSFQISQTRFTIGFYIPIIGFASIYTYLDGVKHPMKYPWQFYGLPIGKRLLATLSGAIGLFLTGTLIFIALAYFEKENIITMEEVNRHGIYSSQQALKDGFQRGDKVVALNGKKYESFYDLVDSEVITDPSTTYTVLRGNKEITINPSVSIDSLNRNEYFFSLLVPFVVGHVEEGSTAEKAGLAKGDRILKVNDQPIIKFQELKEAFLSDEDNKVMLSVIRGEGTNDSIVLSLEVLLDEEHEIGILPRELINYTAKQNSFFESVAIGFHKAVNIPIVQLKAFVKLFRGTVTAKKSISRPTGIAKVYDTYSFWWASAFIAVNILFFNFLPLPKSALWEMIPLAYEGITGKRFSDKLFVVLRRFTILILILLMIMVFLSDLIRLF